MSDDQKKTFERKEIQAALEPVVQAKLLEMGLPEALDDDHTRRTMRSLIRMAAKMGLAKGCPPHFWMGICAEAYQKEAGMDEAKTPEEAQAILTAKLEAKGETN